MGTALLLPLAVLLPFGAALLMPVLDRMFRSSAGWVLAAIPLAILALLPSFSRPDPLVYAAPWALDLNLWIAFRADRLSVVFVGLICVVATAVFPYAAAYMGRDRRFFTTLLCFMGAMLGIVLADDWALLFVFWELTSVTSFLLIGHKRESEEAQRSAKQAFIVTFTGGLGLLVAAAAVSVETGTTRISEVPSLAASPWFALIGFGVVAAAITKSAQFPFHFWLPNAMAAPTPVSAFLHSATMVQAGVYLLARTSPWLQSLPWWSPVLLGFGLTTACVGGALSLFQRDLKKLLAYSTVGALGLLVATIALNAWDAFFAFFLAHGLYKATLFLVAGSIDKVAGTRDALVIRGLGKSARPLQIVALLGAGSMAALPFTMGYLGKEALLHAHSPSLLVVTVAYGATGVAVAWVVGVRGFLGSSAGLAKPLPATMWIAPGVLAVAGVLLAMAGPSLGDWLTHHPWHVSLPAVPSYIGWGLGAALVVGWAKLAENPRRSMPNFDTFYAYGVRSLTAFAGRTTKGFQHGYLNGYVRVVFATFVGLVAFGIVRVLPTAWPTRLHWPQWYEFVIALTMIAGVIAAVASRSRLGAVAALGIVGYGVAVIYVAFGAPDLAMTQIAVETLTLILFVFTFYRLPRPEARRNRKARAFDGVLAAGVGTTMAFMTVLAAGIPNDGRLARFYSEHAYPEGKGHNVVNVILVDFRGFDTLGEITVLSMAALGVFALLRMPRRGGGTSDR